MSRRHHGNRPNRSSGPIKAADTRRPAIEPPTLATDPGRHPRPAADIARPVEPDRNHAPDEVRPAVQPLVSAEPHGSAERADEPQADHPAEDPTVAAAAGAHRRSDGIPSLDSAPPPPPSPAMPLMASNGAPAMPSCTAPQLRRFIKSRPYVPMHELRRRFGINGTEDDVSAIDLGGRRRVFVGLPAREGSLLGELLRAGDIGYELSLDPRTPIVIGLYPMRPVARS